MAWSSAFFHPGSGVSARKGVLAEGLTEGLTRFGPNVNADTQQLVRDLMVSIPEFSFTVEVDLLGVHRVTVHFKGADISVDAMQLGG